MIQRQGECEVGVPNPSKTCLQYAKLENFSMTFQKKWVSRIARWAFLLVFLVFLISVDWHASGLVSLLYADMLVF